MGRGPTLSEVIKIRRMIIALPQEDYEDLLRDIQVIQEIRDEIAKENERKANGDTGK